MLKLNKIAVVGLGLMGASLAAALKKKKAVKKIIGIDQSKEVSQKAEQLAIVDQSFNKIDSKIKEADLIFIAVPVGAISTVITEIEAVSSKEQLIVDLGSTKKGIMVEAQRILTNSNKIFIGGHPMAGSDKSGIDFLDPELYSGSAFILTPWQDKAEKAAEKDLKKNKTSKQAVKIEAKKRALANLKNLLTDIEAKIHIITAEEHDHCTAYLSHLPHLLASSLVNLSEKQGFKKEVLALSGSGYQDMTRIAGSSADLWQDIILSNRKNLAELIENYIIELSQLKKNLEADSETEIYNFLAKAAAIKADFSNN